MRAICRVCSLTKDLSAAVQVLVLEIACRIRSEIVMPTRSALSCQANFSVWVTRRVMVVSRLALVIFDKKKQISFPICPTGVLGGVPLDSDSVGTFG